MVQDAGGDVVLDSRHNNCTGINARGIRWCPQNSSPKTNTRYLLSSLRHGEDFMFHKG